MSEPEPVRLTTPLSAEAVAALEVGDRVLLSGAVYAARDTAHKRLVEMVEAGAEPPIPLAGQAIYYMGPSPARPGRVIGSAGPTTSGRMDPYTPALLAAGVRATIGKGRRSDEVRRALAEHGAVYLGLVGGVAALIARCIVACDVVAFEELGPEAIRRLEFEDLPAFVANDARGRDLYEEATAGPVA
ncbi:MAG: FumA C-terminus/TtdB family hydratase beta subunit [bacterium]